MNRADIIEELRAIVTTDRHTWAGGAFERALKVALNAFNVDYPCTATARLILIANKPTYLLPADLVRYLGTYWGEHPRFKPWDEAYPGPLPRIYQQRNQLAPYLVFSPAPTCQQLAAHGDRFEYWYSIAHVLTDSECTIPVQEYDRFITRALAALMRDLIAANVTEPVQLHHALGSIPNSATPLAAFGALMQAYKDVI